jgi:uncharacterized protein YbaP (TraB family)
MKRPLWFAGLLLFVATLPAARPAAAQAPPASKSFLWKVQGGSGTLYLAGSVHALDQGVYPLSPAFQRAFDAAGALVEEIDLDQGTSLAAAPALLAKGVFQDGRTFDQVVSKDTLALVSERLKGTALPIELIRQMKPWMVDMMLTALDVQQAGLDVAFGLDKYFYDRAAAAGKQLIALETAESQVDRMDRMPLDVQEQMLRSSLQAQQSPTAALAQIVTLWKRGDAAALEKSLLSEFEGFPAAYQSLVVERNRNWMPQLDACLARPTPCFVVVGAAHLVGPDGLLALLQKKGYRIEQQ